MIRSALKAIGGLLLCMLGYYLLNGYQFGENQQLIHFPFIRKIADSSLYEHDILLDTISGFLSYYPAVLGFFHSAGFSLNFLMAVVYILSIASLLAGTILLTTTIFPFFPYPLASTLFLALGPSAAMARAPFLIQIGTHTNLVFGMLLVVCVLFLRDKKTLAFLLLGLFTNLHALSCVHIVGLLLFTQIIQRHPIRIILKHLLLFSLTAAPIILWALSQQGESHTTYDTKWLEALRYRSSHHVFPSSWSLYEFISGALWILLGPICYFLIRKIVILKSENVSFLFSFYVGVVLYCLFGWIFGDIFEIPLILRLQLFRSTKFVYVLSGLLCTYATYLAIKKSLDRRSRLSLWVILFFVFLSTLPTWRYRFRLMSLRFGVVTTESLVKEDFRDVAQWAYMNTKKSCHFVVPPELSGFRVVSERSVYSEWHDGTQQFFDPLFSQEWMKRQSSIIKGNISDELRDELYISHIVQMQPGTLNLPVQYENFSFRVYKANECRSVQLSN